MQSKNILQSKTFWGAVVAAAPSILAASGVDSGTVGQIVTIVGAAAAIYGRSVATKPVHVRKPKANPQR